jgi:hypothetical protein
MSYGHQWVYQGCRKSFIHIIDVYGYKRSLEIWKNNMEKDIMPTKAGTYQRKIYGQIGKDAKWHSKRLPKRKPHWRKPKPEPLNYKVWMPKSKPKNQDIWNGITLGWSNCCIDSPKYIGGYTLSLHNMTQPHVMYGLNTVLVEDYDKRPRFRSFNGANREISA